MDFLYKIDMGKLADIVQSEESTWDKVSDALVKMGKMGFDFIIGDDIKTLLDEDASTLDRVIAGLGLTPGGKLVNTVLKLAKMGDKVVLGLMSGKGKVNLNVTSSIDKDPRLVKAAEQMGKNTRLQKEADDLVSRLQQGNLNPGKGNNSLGFGGIHELRGANGARVYFRS
ncbi:hypothetical protein ACFSCX_24030 [Bacillus salitolerans]|uniref:Pre-toxin TG domain-containing protein n=1 Tax=Bacillus salitolerans TaxID=1437434 RepID=A0ABW4LZJ5_9BACI